MATLQWLGPRPFQCLPAIRTASTSTQLYGQCNHGMAEQLHCRRMVCSTRHQLTVDGLPGMLLMLSVLWLGELSRPACTTMWICMHACIVHRKNLRHLTARRYLTWQLMQARCMVQSAAKANIKACTHVSNCGETPRLQLEHHWQTLIFKKTNPHNACTSVDTQIEMRRAFRFSTMKPKRKSVYNQCARTRYTRLGVDHP